MPNPATRAAEAPFADPELTDHNQYSVGSRLEITQILTAIMRHGALITASPGDDSFFLTSILTIDEERDLLTLECGRSQQQTDLVLKKQRLMCTTALDKVKIQFICEHMALDEEGGRPALKMRIPREMLRLQRREHFRMEIPLSAPVKCTLSQADSGKPQTAKVELQLHDISCGGIAATTPPALFTPELGARYNAVIDLPGSSGVHTCVEARNAFAVTLANGKITQRSGFAFVRPPESLLATIQRYIMNLERARRMRSAGR